MYPRAFAVVANESYLPGLNALLHSLYAYHGIRVPVFVFLHGQFSGNGHQLLCQHPLVEVAEPIPTDEIEPKPLGCWEAKQLALAHLIGKARTVCLLDADLVLLSPLDDVFSLAETGKIVSCRDGKDDREFDAEFSAFSPALCGLRFPYFNSGFLCLDVNRHWDLVGLWAFAARFGAYSPGQGYPLALPGHGDQGHLNAVAALLDKRFSLHLFEQDEWCNSAAAYGRHVVTITGREDLRLLVQNDVTGGHQRLLHSSGPKWWTAEGRSHAAGWGDFLACFDHFATWPK